MVTVALASSENICLRTLKTPKVVVVLDGNDSNPTARVFLGFISYNRIFMFKKSALNTYACDAGRRCSKGTSTRKNTGHRSRDGRPKPHGLPRLAGYRLVFKAGNHELMK